MSTFRKLTVCGEDISEFSLYVDGDSSVNSKVPIKTVTLAEKLSALFNEKYIGKALPIAEEMGSGNYIVLSAHSTNANAYSVKIENGNIYITGNYLSITDAFDHFTEKILGDGEERELDLTSEYNYEGSMGFKVPYTAEQLKELFKLSQERGDMIISGTHTWGSWGNGSQVGDTWGHSLKMCGHCAAILELDVGRYSVYAPSHPGVDTLSDFDLSMIVAESAKFINAGGIISVCIHMCNPLMNAEDKVFYRGRLGSNEVADELLTEGTELNGKLYKTLEPTIRLLKAFKENGLPFMFRPLHEVNGDWFWWCINQKQDVYLSRDIIVRFWKLFYKLLTVELGIDNAVWIYSPSSNASDGAYKPSNLYAYPGDEYVDVVGCDWYTGGDYEIEKCSTFENLQSTDKPIALTEFGPGDGSKFAIKNEEGKIVGFDFTGLDFLEILQNLRSRGKKICYFLTWTYARSTATMKESKALLESDIVMNLEDLASYWKKLNG
ncbi:MAG: hypothetical protein IJZ89_02095 [Clostridia bacterium]|nr:hypothetical protein [Clostridia bacterium]